jgi:predicted MFS family arabinose efflux permease
VANPSVLADSKAVVRSPDAARVLIASLIGRLPSGSAPLALLLFARQSMSIAVAGMIVGVYIAGFAVGQPILARLVDRRRQGPVLWLAVTVSTLGFLITAAHPGLALTVAGTVLAGLGGPPFEACLRALWRDIVEEPLVPAAYTLDVTSQELIFILGPMVTLGSIALFGPAGGLYATAAAQLIGTVLFATAPAARHWRGETVVRHWAGPLRSIGIRVLLGTALLVGAGIGAVAVAVTAFAEHAGARSWSGWLLAAQAGGALIGGLLYTRATPGDTRRLPLLATVFAVLYLPLLATPGPAFMAVLVAVSGLALPPLLTAVFLAADRLAPHGTAVEAFAWIMTAFTVGSALGAALTGPLVERQLRYGFAFAPAIGLVAVLCMALVAVARVPAGTTREEADLDEW